MTGLWGTLAPLVLAGAILPSFFILEILLLQSPRGGAKALAFVSGFVATKLAQGVVFGLILGAASGGSAAGGPSPVTTTLLLVAGLMFFAIAIRNLMTRPADAATAPPWMSAVDNISVLGAFGFGLAADVTAMNLWAFTLAAISAIQEAGLSQGSAILNYLVFVVLSLMPMILIALVPAVLPKRSAKLLAAFREWLIHQQRLIMIILGLVLGTALTVVALARFGLL